MMTTNVVKLSELKEKEWMKKVDNLIQFGAYKKVIQCCDEFIKINRKHPKLYMIKHEVHVNLGKYEESLRDANDLLEVGCEREGLLLKLFSLTLLLKKPGLLQVSQDSWLKEKRYVKEMKEIAERAFTAYLGDTQIVYLVAEGCQLTGMKDKAISVLEEHLKIVTVHGVY
jgi:tetratricopeptide (TPR) repeat protein